MLTGTHVNCCNCFMLGRMCPKFCEWICTSIWRRQFQLSNGCLGDMCICNIAACICGYSNKCTSEMSSCSLHQIEAWAMLLIQCLQLVSSASNKKPCSQSEAACTYLDRVVNTPRLQHKSLARERCFFRYVERSGVKALTFCWGQGLDSM